MKLGIIEAQQGLQGIFEPATTKPADKEKWLNKLSYCESRNNPCAVGDEGLSKGELQFHAGTFLAYNSKYQILPELEKTELENVWADSWVQNKLADKMLTEEGGWRHWLICSKLIGLDKVDWNAL